MSPTHTPVAMPASFVCRCLTCATTGIEPAVAIRVATTYVSIRISHTGELRGRRVVGRLAGRHHLLVELLHLLPRCRDGALQPRAIAAHRGAAKQYAVVGFSEHSQPPGAAAATASGKRTHAVGNPFPERAVRRLILGANLRMHFAGVREHVLDAPLDRHVDDARHLAVAVEAEQHALVAKEAG